MGRRTLEVLTGLSGNGAVGRVSANLPMGLDYMRYSWWVSAGAAITAAGVTELRETLNSDITKLYSGTQQDLMNQFDVMQAAYAAGVGTMVMPCELMGMKDVVPTYSTTRNTNSKDPDTNKAITQLRLDLVQAVATTHRLFTEVDDGVEGGPGGITRILQYQESPGGGAPFSLSGKVPLSDPQRRWLRRCFFDVSAGNLNADMQIVRGMGNEQVFIRPKTLNDRNLLDWRQRAPAAYGGAASFVLDGTETGIPEMYDTMDVLFQSNASDMATARLEVAAWLAKNQGQNPLAVVMGNQVVKPGVLFDMRPQPSAAATLTATPETVGRL